MAVIVSVVIMAPVVVAAMVMARVIAGGVIMVVVMRVGHGRFRRRPRLKDASRSGILAAIAADRQGCATRGGAPLRAGSDRCTTVI
jgi:hypothetical protein